MKKITWLFFLLISTIVCAQSKKAIIIDTDVGIDDEIAILYLLKSHNVSIKAITIAADGNAHCMPALKNTEGMLKLMQQTNIPVACGPDKPLMGHHHFTDTVLTESDLLGGTAAMLPTGKIIYSGNAVDLLIQTIQKEKSIDILAIGPLTNLALAIQKTPELKQHIRMIYIMGGAIHVRGNLPDVDPQNKNTLAEWNIYLDPLAANIVFRSGIPITLVPLDVTNKLPIDWAFYQAMKKHDHTPAAHLTYEIMHHNENLLKTPGWWYFWDPLAAVIANSSIATFKTENLRVILQPEIQSGAIIIDNKNGTPIHVSEEINVAKFKNLLLEHLSSV